MERVPITPEGKEKMVEELSNLKRVERHKAVRDIEEARAHGDLSENAEYHAAKDKQGQIEGRIRMLEDMLGRAEVIDPTRSDGSRVVFGVTVGLYDPNQDQEFHYQIVGEYEADIDSGRISIKSPIARALIGKEVGDAVVVQTPGGKREFELTKISSGKTE